jgi:hypothetical protein
MSSGISMLGNPLSVAVLPAGTFVAPFGAAAGGAGGFSGFVAAAPGDMRGAELGSALLGGGFGPPVGAVGGGTTASAVMVTDAPQPGHLTVRPTS